MITYSVFASGAIRRRTRDACESSVLVLPDRAEAPHLPQQLVLLVHARRLLGQLREELELLRREQQAAAGDQDTPGRPVDADLPRLEHVALLRRCPPEHGPDPRTQLLVCERPVDVVVGAALERAGAVDGVRRLAAQQDHRDVAIPRAARHAVAQARAELQLGDEDEVGAHALGQVEDLARVAGAEHVEPVVGELALEEAAGLGLGFGDDQRG